MPPRVALLRSPAPAALAICLCSAATSGWLSVSPRARASARFDLGLHQRACAPPTCAGDHHRARRAGKLAVRSPRSELCAAARSASTLRISERVASSFCGDRGRAADHLGVLGLEGEALLLGRFAAASARSASCWSRKVDRVAHFAARAAEVLLAEDVDQLLDHVLRQLRVLAVGQVAAAAFGGDDEEVCTAVLLTVIVSASFSTAISMSRGAAGRFRRAGSSGSPFRGSPRWSASG